MASPKSFGLVTVEADGHAVALTGFYGLSIVKPDVIKRAVVKSFFDLKFNFCIFLLIGDKGKLVNLIILRIHLLYL